MSDLTRGKYTGPEIGSPPDHDAENYYRCERCGVWVDRRDTVQVFDHVRPLPHITEGREN